MTATNGIILGILSIDSVDPFVQKQLESHGFLDDGLGIRSQGQVPLNAKPTTVPLAPLKIPVC